MYYVHRLNIGEWHNTLLLDGFGGTGVDLVNVSSFSLMMLYLLETHEGNWMDIVRLLFVHSLNFPN